MEVNDTVIEAAFYEHMGRFIEAKRIQRKMSQSVVAEMMGVHRNTIMRWESGDCRIDTWHLLRLADVLSINHLLLLPPRQYTWGRDLSRLFRERDERAMRIQEERDPKLTQREVA
jgi:transcriptional regulator with XRE-family HTH domain